MTNILKIIIECPVRFIAPQKLQCRIVRDAFSSSRFITVLLILLVLCSLNAIATEQVMDKLEYGGQNYLIGIESKGLSRPLWYFPLDSYLEREEITLRKRLQPLTSACRLFIFEPLCELFLAQLVILF